MTRALALALTLAAFGCENPRTEVLVLVDVSGLEVPRDLDALHVTVADKALTGTAATLYDSQALPLCHPGMVSGCYHFPITFALVPGDQRPSDPVRVHVQALLGTEVVIDDAATFTFIKGTSSHLDFILFADCLNTDCAASDRACASDGQCAALSPQPFAGELDLAVAAQPDLGGESDLSTNDLSVGDLATGDLSMNDLTSGDLTTPPDLTTMLVCDGGLVDVTSDPQNCGACGAICPNPTPKPNTAASCTNQICGIGCQSGWGDCNGGSDGCEHDVSGDALNCGACGHVCGNANVIGNPCSNNACVFNCAPGTKHCSTSDLTGCETTITTDSHNCGFCGFDCGSAPCVSGVCRYTAGGEGIQTQTSLSVLVEDTSSLYWFGDTCGSIHVIRKVNKDGTGLADVWMASKIGCPDQGATLAVDQNFLYFFNDTYKTKLTKGVKTGVQDPTDILADDKIGASGSGVYLDSDDSATAQYLFMTQVSNGPGLYRVNLASPVAPPQGIFTSGDARGMVRAGALLYFGTPGTNQIQSFDMHAATPSPQVFATLGGASRGLASDGVNVYAMAGDGNLWAISIATKSTSMIATSGPSDGTLATDGTHVYVASGDLYRVPVNGSGTYASYRWVTASGLPTGGSILGVQVDANAVYFATFFDVYKTRK